MNFVKRFFFVYGFTIFLLGILDVFIFFVPIKKENIYKFSDFFCLGQVKFFKQMKIYEDIYAQINSILEKKDLFESYKLGFFYKQTKDSLSKSFYSIKEDFESLFYIYFDEPVFCIPKFRNYLQNSKKIVLDILDILIFLTKGKKDIVILFLNSSELRATGGFMGSFYVLNLENGYVKNSKIYDIYDYDGQIDYKNNYIKAPFIVKKYLSDNEYLNITDSNWDPSFNKSASVFSYYYELINKRKPALIVSINLNTIQNFLDHFGFIVNVDDQVLDSFSFESIAREYREDFFPGDKRKVLNLEKIKQQIQKKFLSSNINKLKYFVFFIRQIENREIMFYSPFIIQTRLDSLNVSGSMDNLLFFYDCKVTWPLYLLCDKKVKDFIVLISSNISINKANKFIFEQYKFSLDFDDVYFTVEYFNFSDKNYVGYERLFFSNGIKVIGPLEEKKSEYIKEFLENDNFHIYNDKISYLDYFVKLKPQESKKFSFLIKNFKKDFLVYKQPGKRSVKTIIQTQKLDVKMLENYLLISTNNNKE